MKLNAVCSRILALLFVLLCHYASWAYDVDSTTISKISSTFEKIKSENRLVGEFKESDMASLPIGILKEINGQAYVIAIDQARFTPKGAFFNIYAQLALPGTNEVMSFAAVDVAFSPGGIAAAAGTKLELVSTHTIAINDKVNLVLPGDHSNYIEWDCNGFKSVNLKGQFKFQKGFLEPLNPKDTQVVASFTINAQDLHNILARVDITPFTMSGIRDFGFEVKEAVVDMSDIINPDGMVLNSADAAAWGGEVNLWQGFYLKQLNIYLPQELADSKGKRPMISARDMMIDNSGVSGKFSASNIIKIGEASAGGWPLSVDFVEVQLQHNKLVGGSLKGNLNVSFLGDQPLRYLAAIETRQEGTYYAFSLSLTDSVTFHTFAGDISLFPNSTVKLEKYKGQFIPSAVLHGRIDINKGILNAPGIAFQDLTLSTQSPYVHKGTLSLDGSIGFKIGQFSCSFDNISMGLSTGKFAIGADVRIALMNSEDKGFSATTGIKVLGSVKEEKEMVTTTSGTVEETHTHWSFDRLKVESIAISVKTTAFQIDGMIALYEDDPIYGNGFKGKISLKLPALPAKIEAHAMFGAKDDYRYWHFDAFVPIRIPITTGFSIRRLLGGLSYHMERPPVLDPYSMQDSDTTGMKDADALLNYVPSKDVGIGFLAGVTIATDPTATVFNGDVMLEIMFSAEGGLRYVQFDGSAFFFTEMAKRDANSMGQAPISAQVYIRYDNTNSSFHASIKTYINVFEVLKGTGPNNLACEAVMHFEPGAWWMYVGRPSQMMGLTVAGIATVQSYFMAGTKVEDMPPPPPEVMSVLDNIGDGNFMEAENSMSTGRGIGFGLHFKVSLGIGKDGGFIYAYLGVGAGSDIMLRDYGEARCKGGGGQIGINGWYASGQAYAYLQGRVGVRVKVLGKKKEFDILYLSAAALLQAKFPNPAWLRGAVGVQYSILGGLVKGKASVKMEIGQQCELVTGKEIDIKIINDLQPGDLSKDISVFGSPQVAFNLAIEKSFSMMNNEDVVSTYRVKMDEFKLTDKKTGVVPSTLQWNDGKDVATLNFRDILPPDADLTANVKVHIEKWNGTKWEALADKGVVDYETKSVTFHTGIAPDNIPAENIAYCYPVNQQYNFYKKESGRGYVKLKRGQPYLFTEKDADGTWKFNARFATDFGGTVNVALSYDANNTQVNFDIPATLETEAIYHMALVKTPANATSGNDNVSVNSTTTNDDDNETTVTEKTLKGVVLAATEKALMENAFRTSKYSTFKEKMAATSNTMDLLDIATDYVPVIGKRFDSYETFDKFELDGDGAQAPLVFARAVPASNWLQNRVIPLLYKSYPMDNDITIDYRDVNLLGSPPLLAVSVFNNDPTAYQLTSEAVSAGTAPPIPGRFRVMYFLNYVGHMDYYELLSKSVAKYLSSTSKGVAPAGIQQLLSTPYPDMEMNQQYSVELNYRLPGTNTVTSTVNYNILYK